VKISNKKFSFFSSRNQYFPQIPYVSSKKEKKAKKKAEKPSLLLLICCSMWIKLVRKANTFVSKISDSMRATTQSPGERALEHHLLERLVYSKKKLLQRRKKNFHFLCFHMENQNRKTRRWAKT
jgi:hypothetical protein